MELWCVLVPNGDSHQCRSRIFSGTDPYRASIGSGSVTSNQLLVRDGVVYLEMDNSYTVNSTSTSLSVPTIDVSKDSSSGTGALLFVTNNAGTLFSNGVSVIGNQQGSAGTVVVRDIYGHGPGTWVNGTSLYVGNSGTGTLNLFDGGRVFTQNAVLGNNNDGVGTIRVNGHGTLFQSTVNNYIGNSGTGTLNVENGGMASAQINYLGYNNDSNGTVTVTDTGSKLQSTNATFVGYSGTGTLTVQNHGSAAAGYTGLGYNTNSNGTATVTGTGSTLSSTTTSVGVYGNGTLNVQNGGLVTSQDSYLGAASGAVGTVTVDGLGSKFQSTGSNYVGYSGTGTLNVLNGGQASAQYNYAGYSAGSQGAITVDGTQSLFQSGALYVGNSGTGTLDITSGGHATAQSSYVGNNSSGTGTVTVTGAGSSLENSSQMTIGWSGTGILNVLNGAQVTAPLGINIAYGSGSHGTVTIDGADSQMTTSAGLQIGALGTLSVQNGGLSSAGVVSVQGGVIVDGTGSLLQSSGSNYGGHIYVGQYGNGTLTVQNGGHATVSGNNYLGYSSSVHGTVTVTGAGSQITASKDTYIGNSGIGKLDVLSGGLATANNNYLGYNYGSQGTITVDGVGSQLTSAFNTHVGYTGTGNMIVLNGGSATAANTTIGLNNGSQGMVTVDGVGSQITSAFTTIVGNSGTGNMGIQNGGLAIAQNSIVAYNNGSHGTVTVDGAGSHMTSTSDTIVGLSGTGTLTVQNGGLATAQNTYVALSSGSHGNVTVTGAGSTLQTTNLYVGGSSSGPGGIGVMTVNNSGSVVINSGGQAVVWSTGTLNLDGNLVNNGTFTNSGGTINLGSNAVLSGSGVYNVALAIVNGTTLSPGNSPGTMTFNGNQSWGGGGILDEQILNPTGTAGTDWDSITINGDLYLTATSANPFDINLQTLSSASTAGLLAGFDPTQNYEWLFLTDNGSIYGFDPSEFFISTSGFWNSFGGTFSVREVGNQLFLDYNAPSPATNTPEPSTLMLLGLALPGTLIAAVRRRRKTSQAA